MASESDTKLHVYQCVRVCACVGLVRGGLACVCVGLVRGGAASESDTKLHVYQCVRVLCMRRSGSVGINVMV